MKSTKMNCVIFLVFILITPNIFSNENKTTILNKLDDPKYRLAKLHYENSSGENGVTIFEYDENEIMNKAKWKLVDGSRYSTNFYKYDDSGNLTTKYREFSDGITSIQSYEYDSNKNLITEHFQRSDGISGIAKYEYDEKGNLIKAKCDGLNGWFFGVITYSYGESGNKLKGDITQKNENTGTIDYSYDKNGNLIKEHWDFSGKWSQTFVYEYEEDVNSQ